MRTGRRWVGALAGVVVLLTAVPASAVSLEGNWTGSTSQDRRIRLVVGGDERIHLVRITIDYANDDCSERVRWQFGLDARIRDDRTFRVKLVDELDDRDVAIVRGEFVTRRRAEGRFKSVLVEGDGCELRSKGTWKATRVQSASL